DFLLASTFLYSLSEYLSLFIFLFFLLTDTATTEIYTLSLHDALPISRFRFKASDESAICCNSPKINCGIMIVPSKKLVLQISEILPSIITLVSIIFDYVFFFIFFI